MDRKPGKLTPLEKPSTAQAGMSESKLRKSAIIGKKPRPATTEVKGDSGPVSPKVEEAVVPQVKEQKRKKRRAALLHRNITDGLILGIVIEPEDEVSEDVHMEGGENYMELLDGNVTRTISFMENLKKGSFNQIYNTAVVNLRPEKVVSRSVTAEHLEIELKNLIYEYDDVSRKIFVFCQGLFAGLSALHIYLFSSDSDDRQNLASYARFALRLNQIFHIIALISTSGSLVELVKYYKFYSEARKRQSDDLIERRKNYITYVITFSLYALAFALTIFSHEFVSIVSNRTNIITTVAESLLTRFVIFKVINIILTVIAILAWILVVKSSYSDSAVSAQLVDEANLTRDEMDLDED
eukprot:TRINITY_DN4069_c0_g4_i1.p1 TRINITY_DN4069_c0_g4~~TRINITY_DN4069_c0_g4_i1.p1  ORF type:complete len:354 (+),score=39.19 TRINITY_DN4069_c0_g4_i1:42-1103(+)